MRLAIKYARDGAAKYISHLDMQRAFGRALRRANAPVLFSRGFNPHIVMSFASPLSVGYATRGDYVEVGAEDGADPAAVLESLNAVLPPGIRALSVFPLPEGTKKLMALMHGAAWRISFFVENEADCGTIEKALCRILAQNVYAAADRRGKTADIRPMVFSAQWRGCGVDAVLAASSAMSMNPAVLAMALAKEAGVPANWEICREECFFTRDGRELPLDAL